MPEVQIFHNPRCSKSRAALKALEARGVEAEVIAYLKEPPSPEALDALCRKLGLPPQALIRTGERRFRELGLRLDDDRSRAEWLRILSENPILIERPVVVSGDRAVIGRPLENVLALLDETL
ncbi:arsenate reductase (glutaredoxin) [Rhodocaloribacter sp.]